MNQEQIKQFKNQVWATRVSRINAEKRLNNKEAFIQGINVYYSCFTIVFSILSLLEKDDKLSLMTTLMTISLLISVLYLNGQKYLEHAREYRKNYTELHKLELQLGHIGENDIEEIKKIEQIYCDLLDSSSNHITFDYCCTVFSSNSEYKEKYWESVRGKYYCGIIIRFIIKMCIVILPFVLYGICEVI